MILLAGAGAVGTILAAHLEVAGRQKVRLLMRENHLEQVGATMQLRVDFPGTRAPLIVKRPEVSSFPELTDVDYLLVCVKYPDLAPLLDSLPPVPERCTVVSALNGVAPLRLLRNRLPQTPVVPLIVMFNGQLLAPLHAEITTKPQILIATQDGRLLSSFDSSGMQVARAAGETAVWGKLLINLANAVNGLTHSTFRDLLTDRDLRVTYVALLDEAIAVLDTAGIEYDLPVPLPYPAYRRFLLHGGQLPWWVTRFKNGVTDRSYSSMVADLERGRRTEVDQLNGEIVQLAERHGAEAPVNDRVVQLVKKMESMDDRQWLSPAQLRKRLGA